MINSLTVEKLQLNAWMQPAILPSISAGDWSMATSAPYWTLDWRCCDDRIGRSLLVLILISSLYIRRKPWERSLPDKGQVEEASPSMRKLSRLSSIHQNGPRAISLLQIGRLRPVDSRLIHLPALIEHALAMIQQSGHRGIAAGE